MTICAVKALKECDVIIGYTVYVDFVNVHSRKAFSYHAYDLGGKAL